LNTTRTTTAKSSLLDLSETRLARLWPVLGLVVGVVEVVGEVDMVIHLHNSTNSPALL